MQITIVMMVIGAIFVFLSYNFSKRTFSVPVLLLGLGFITLSRTVANSVESIMLAHAGPTISLCIGGILIGALIVFVMFEAFQNSQPHSTSCGQFMMFGWYKWDDFAEIMIWGALILLCSASTLYSEAERAFAYGRANQSVQAIEANKNQTRAAVSKNAHHSAPNKAAKSTGSKPRTHKTNTHHRVVAHHT